MSYLTQGARFDDTRTYRYDLWRTWADAPRLALWIMLNPSTADEHVLDPTLRRCEGFSRAWGFGGFHVCNIFALRSTDPRALYRHADPVGPENNARIFDAVERCDLVVCGWGTHGRLLGRGPRVAELLAPAAPQCLGTTKGGHPRHPLYLPKSAQLVYL